MNIKIIYVPCEKCGGNVDISHNATLFDFFLTKQPECLAKRPRHLFCVPEGSDGPCIGTPELAQYLPGYTEVQPKVQPSFDLQQAPVVRTAYSLMLDYLQDKPVPPFIVEAIAWSQQMRLMHCTTCLSPVPRSNNLAEFLLRFELDPVFLTLPAHHLMPVIHAGEVTCPGRPEISRYLAGQERNPPGATLYDRRMEPTIRGLYKDMQFQV